MNKKQFSIILFSFLSLIDCVMITQYLAHSMHYDPLLGQYLFKINNVHIYPPFQFAIWSFKFRNFVPQLVETALNYFFILFLAEILLLALINKPQKKLTSHGTATWATTKDISKTGLLKSMEDDGVIIGITGAKYKKDSKDTIVGVTSGKYIKDDGPTHTLVIAPTRSGKGVGIIIPTLLTWHHSVLVTDVKGENWGITAGYRKLKGYKVLKFEPTAPIGAASFNPLNEIRIGTVNEARDVQNICDILVDPQGIGKIEHWERTAHALLTGIIFHLKYREENVTLADIEAYLTDPLNPFEEKVEAFLAEMEAENDGSSFELCHQDSPDLFIELYNRNSRYHPFVAQEFRSILNKPEKERGSVISTAESFLKLYKDPLIKKNTSKSDFHITDLMDHEKPVSLYLVFNPADLVRLRPLLRMIITQTVCRLTEQMKFENGKPVKSYKHKLLLLIDEFPALGKLEQLETALAFIAGYGMKALLIAQSNNQLNKIYTNNNSIVDNCHTRVFYTPNEHITAEWISKMLGQKTEYLESISYQDMKYFGKQSISVSEHSRSLMTSDEVMTLPKDEEIILIAGSPPIRCQKVFYFVDEKFKKRLLSAPKISDKITKKG